MTPPAPTLNSGRLSTRTVRVCLIYCTGEEGEVIVARAGQTFEVLARNSLGASCLATPAISEGTLFFRTRSHLLAVTG